MNTQANGPVASSGMTSNVAGLLCYVLGFITGIVFLVLDPYKKDSFVRFHAFQSIFFNLGIFVFWIAFMILSAIMGAVFGLFGFLMGLLGILISLLFFFYWLFLMYKAYNKELYKVPIVGELAAKQAAGSA